MDMRHLKLVRRVAHVQDHWLPAFHASTAIALIHNLAAAIAAVAFLGTPTSAHTLERFWFRIAKHAD